MTAYTNIENPAYTFGTHASGINDGEQIVGYGGLFNQGFLYSSGAYTPISLSGIGTKAHGINDASQIVGDYDGGFRRGARPSCR